VIPAADLAPQSDAQLVITRADGSKQTVTVKLRIDTPIEVDYYRHGGILPYVLRQLLAVSKKDNQRRFSGGLTGGKLFSKICKPCKPKRWRVDRYMLVHACPWRACA
jgi:DNA polymerase elongation subunit (family B)